MSNTFHTNNSHWERKYAYTFYGFKGWGETPADPYEVVTIRVGDEVLVKSSGFKKYLPMYDRWWFYFTGRTWEGEVRKAQTEAFEAAYRLHAENEKKNYSVERLDGNNYRNFK